MESVRSHRTLDCLATVMGKCQLVRKRAHSLVPPSNYPPPPLPLPPLSSVILFYKSTLLLCLHIYRYFYHKHTRRRLTTTTTTTTTRPLGRCNFLHCRVVNPPSPPFQPPLPTPSSPLDCVFLFHLDTGVSPPPPPDKNNIVRQTKQQPNKKK